MERPAPSPRFADRAMAFDRAFVLALGGFSYDVAGASFVTHERIPVPRFNFVLTGSVGADRNTSFFERALDHYFQRALRPTFRVPFPVPPHIHEGLRRFSFARRSDSYTILWTAPGRRPVPEGGAAVRAAETDELDLVAGLWTEDRGRDEIRRAIDVLWNHPNPGEAATPILAEIDGRTVGGGVVYAHDGVAGLHGIGTVAELRGKGVATALVTHALSLPSVAKCGAVALGTDSAQAIAHLQPLGFAVLRQYAEYELPAGAELDLPDPGPPQPPRWRPPLAGARS